MSDTPETDTKQHFMYMDAVECVEIDFARKLERERDDARLQVKLLRVENNHNWQANDLAEQAFRERDEARQALREIHELLQRDAAWDTPNNVSRSLVMIEHICDWALQKEGA